MYLVVRDHFKNPIDYKMQQSMVFITGFLNCAFINNFTFMSDCYMWGIPIS